MAESASIQPLEPFVNLRTWRLVRGIRVSSSAYFNSSLASPLFLSASYWLRAFGSPRTEYAASTSVSSSRASATLEARNSATLLR